MLLQPFQQVGSPSPGAISGWLSNNSPLPHAGMASGPSPSLMQSPSAGAFLKHHRTPMGVAGIDYQSAESDQLMKRIRMTQPDEVSVSGVAHISNSYLADDLPKTVVRALNQGSNVTSMDFHPQQETILLVGTNVGEISLWEVGTRERISHKPFKVWDLPTCSKTFQTALLSDAAIAVNRCVWGPNGLILGVAFSKHLAQTYSYSPTGDLRPHLELDAHIGGVNDIAFAHPNKQLCIVTCGDDKIIKVWDAVTGRRMYTLEGHDAPVYSICPHYKENIQFVFSTAVDGKIKAWLYDCLGSRVDYDAPGKWCTMMQYNTDGTRLFSCGTSKEGETHLVEWNESEGVVKRAYSGFKKRSLDVVQFDTTGNRFLVAGDEFQIKFWDMDNTNMLTVIDADGGLPASPRVRFNKDGSMLAVNTSDNLIKILANNVGMNLFKMIDRTSNNGNRGLTEALTSKPSLGNTMGPVSSAAITMERPDGLKPVASVSNMANADVKPRMTNGTENIIGWKLAEVLDPSQLNALKLPDPMATSKVARLIYTNSGLSLLALASNAVHKLWKWPRNERNPSDKSTASIVPQLWQPSNGTPMTNDVNQTTPAEESAACMALSKNDSYVMSASGGKVSLFNITSFKVMTTFMHPPPAATYLAFHPKDNNFVAVGMEDSSIHIYNVRTDEVGVKLKGHQKRITGLAFSPSLNTLVSSGADAQICLWSIDQYEKKKIQFIQMQESRSVPLTGETKVQYHNDQTHLLVIHESQISIYDSNLECLRSWFPNDSLRATISSAVYSCDGLLVYAAFCNGTVGIFDVDRLKLRCRIAPSAYIPSSVSGNVYPLVLASHPSDPNQIALGMSNGTVHVLEPTDAEPKKHGDSQSQENGSHPASSSNPALSSHPPDHPSK